MWFVISLKSRPCEKADYRTSALLKTLKINLIYPKKKQTFKIARVRKSAREFSYGLDIKFKFSEKATKIDKIFTVDFTFT